MQNVFSIIQKVVPEINDAFTQRLAIMRILAQQSERIGRKSLAGKLNVTERLIRSSVQVLREQSLVDVNRRGIQITELGQEILKAIDQSVLAEETHQFYELEQALKHKLKVNYCKVVPGDVTIDMNVYALMSQAVQEILDELLGHKSYVIAVTGGETLAQVGNYFTPELAHNRELTFVPTRGGFGGKVEIQSNNVGGVMAERTNSQYVPLFVPENVDAGMSELLMQNSSIKYAVDISRQADCLLLSIGTADVMAQRREITEEQLDEIHKRKAVGEAFGVFFDIEGNSIIRYPRIGIQLEDVAQIPLTITIAGGANKAVAIEAFFKISPNQGWLVCDEALAKQVLNGETQ